jgi:hypothetical protein
LKQYCPLVATAAAVAAAVLDVAVHTPASLLPHCMAVAQPLHLLPLLLLPPGRLAA